MNQNQAREGRYKIAFAVVLIIVLLTSCVFVGSILAWLKDRDNPNSSGEIEIGSVDFEIWSGDTNLTTMKNNADGLTVISATSQPLEIKTAGTIKAVDLKIRNTGTVSAIMRVTLSVYYEDNNGVKSVCLIQSTPTLNNAISINNAGWVNDFKGGVAAGYSYYNSQIKPYTIRTKAEDGTIVSEDVADNAVSVMTQIFVPTTMASTNYYVTLTVEGVAYSGNIYREEAAGEGNNDILLPGEGVYPFGKIASLPTTWIAWKE